LERWVCAEEENLWKAMVKYPVCVFRVTKAKMTLGFPVATRPAIAAAIFTALSERWRERRYDRSE